MEPYLRFATEVTNRSKKSDLEDHRRFILGSNECLRVCLNSLALLLDSKLLEPLDIPEDIPSEPDPIVRYFSTPLLPRTCEKLREWDHLKRKTLAVETALVIVEISRNGLSQLIKSIDKGFNSETFYVRTLAILIHLAKKSQNFPWNGEPKEESVLYNDDNTLTDILCNLILVLSIFATEEVGLFTNFRELPKSLLSLLPRTLGVHILGIMPTLAFDSRILFSLESRESFINSLADQFFNLVDHLILLTKSSIISFDPSSYEISFTMNSGSLEDPTSSSMVSSAYTEIYRYYLSIWLRFSIDYVKYGSLLCRSNSEACSKLINWLSRVLEYRSLNVIGNLFIFEDIRYFEDVVKLAKATDSNLYVSSLIHHSSLTTQDSLRMIKFAGLEVISRDSVNSRYIFSFLVDGLSSNNITIFLETWKHLLYPNNIGEQSVDFLVKNHEPLLDRLLPLSVFDFTNMEVIEKYDAKDIYAEDRLDNMKPERNDRDDAVFLVRDVIVLLVSIIGYACKDRLLSSFSFGYSILFPASNHIDTQKSGETIAEKELDTNNKFEDLIYSPISSWSRFSSEEIGTLELSLFILYILRNECKDSKMNVFIEKIRGFDPNVDERIEFILDQINNDNFKHLHLSDAFRVFSSKKKFRNLIDSDLDWIKSFSTILQVCEQKRDLQFGDGNIFQLVEEKIAYFKYPIFVGKNSEVEYGSDHLFTEFGAKMASSIVSALSTQIGMNLIENQVTTSSKQSHTNGINELTIPKNLEAARDYLEKVSLLLRVYREYPNLIPKGKKGQSPKELPIFQISIALLVRHNDLLQQFIHILTDLILCGITVPLKIIGSNFSDIQTLILVSLRCILAEVLKCDKAQLTTVANMFSMFDFIAYFVIKSLNELVSLTQWSSGNYRVFTILLEILAYSFQIGPILRLLLENGSKMQIIFQTIFIANTLGKFHKRLIISRNFLNLSLITRLLRINPNFNSNVQQKYFVKSGSMIGGPSCAEFIDQQLDRIFMKNCASFQVCLDEGVDPAISGSFNLLDVIAYVSFKQIFKGSKDLRVEKFINVEENPLLDIDYNLLEKLCVIESSVFSWNLLDTEYRLSLECIERLFSGFPQLPQTKLLLIAEYFFIFVAASTGREYGQVKTKILKDNMVNPNAALFIYELYRNAKSHLYE
ncbi:hypothetical protein BEWA_044230 [Theileria equi strain WA]|uniref:Uncharacterized protein n=1 Tax=Theileria equi strain WA TaxID=1537102 RepID=L1LG94_THEEQ|nr:hypothetical protein BEWA_044230 [Theileria equi strain WA]EKX74381.1 hypothetical protein BEWA_044230 [Theileria equi strain WA]|eukprot:XP_004833833.1 hypothetical protein BEWA_044230 [Theileria equi strain WA]